jgi:hypothetical protein
MFKNGMGEGSCCLSSCAITKLMEVKIVLFLSKGVSLSLVYANHGILFLLFFNVFLSA